MHAANIDHLLLGLEVGDDPGRQSFVVRPHLARGDGRLYGGSAVAASVAAIEEVSGRPALWCTTQFIGTAAVDERITLDAVRVASGRPVDQVQVQGTARERLVFTAVGAAATPSPTGVSGIALVMPEVEGPAEGEDWMLAQMARIREIAGLRSEPAGEADTGVLPPDEDSSGGAPVADATVIGHHLVTEYRHATLVRPDPARPGHMALWARLSGELATGSPAMTPTVLAFLADMVPLAIARACGVDGVGTSLDNTLRFGEVVDTDWVLLELEAHLSVGGFGHGHVHCWTPDGHLLATGSQSARMHTLEDLVARYRG